ncbi:g6470 [Coccomyxa viridis]|uniref:G6470 protein n=1 Tax=Coccomyxa viridis TaxID=1274662 RepID=A0ABP1FVG5_9CHLO
MMNSTQRRYYVKVMSSLQDSESLNDSYGAQESCQEKEAASWRDFRASLVHQERAGLFTIDDSSRRLGVLPRNWAHEIGSPERGCLLVARQPNMGSLYSHAVILILEHDAQESAGFIINAPSNGGRIKSCAALPEIASAFKQQLLYQGGSLATERLHLLHGNAAVTDTYEVIDGIYTGGLAHANELVQAGRARAREFRLLAGYMHWHEGSLGAEVARGDWWLVAASREYLLSLVRGQQQQQYGMMEKTAIWRNTIHLAGLSPGLRQHF